MPDIAGVQRFYYTLQQGSSPNIQALAAGFEAKTLRAEAAAMAMEAMREQGYVPDMVIAHPGWGEALFVKDIWPASYLLAYHEYYYSSRGADVGFDPEFGNQHWSLDALVRVKNAHLLLSLQDMDGGFTPTAWQHSTLPVEYRNKVDIIFDGVDTDIASPAESLTITLGNGRALRSGDEVITFACRNLEPLRGYHVMMRALPAILRARPAAVVLIIGGSGLSYGAAAPDGRSWCDIFLSEVINQLDMSRVFFLGNIPYSTFISILRLSACHVYLTYPFVLSWSCIEAMSCACLVVGSNTPPVAEVIQHEKNGLLVDFFDVDGLSRTVIDVLSQPQKFLPMRAAARRSVLARYDLRRICLPALIGRVECL